LFHDLLVKNDKKDLLFFSTRNMIVLMSMKCQGSCQKTISVTTRA